MLNRITPGRFSRHIGNTLSWEIFGETEKPQIRVEDETQESQKNRQCILWIFGSDLILYPLYRKLFGILNRIR